MICSLRTVRFLGIYDDFRHEAVLLIGSLKIVRGLGKMWRFPAQSCPVDMFSENLEGFGQFPAGDYRTNMLTEDGPSFVQILKNDYFVHRYLAAISYVIWKKMAIFCT